jgi:UDP-N-acetylmuramyl pentapeptide phosphotransferase/UDP-N-acetylglucosamine-1-phosphate transferase
VSSVILGLGAAFASWLLTWLVIRYAHAAQMHDVAGTRRMHVQPTVRGAGLGFVAVVLAGWSGWGFALGWEHPLGRWALGASVALLLVAIVSWIDDRVGLPVLPRLAAHVIAALLMLAATWPTLSVELPWPLALLLPMLVLPAINFWNFLDGINGLAATQAIVAAATLSALALMAGDVASAWFGAVVAGAVLGFLPRNFPRAQAFMGDVGSASLGLIVAALALQPVDSAPAMRPAALLLIAVVFLDAGLTLAWRMLRRPRRRWYTAHREHLYQWLARSGWGHTRTTLTYLACAAGIASIVLLIGPLQVEHMLIAASVVYLCGAIAWRLGRDRALARMRGKA